jgi:hypothetical protein
MLRAEFAGSGKSFACKAMEERGYKVLFVCPTNKLAQNNLENGCTLNAFFAVGLTDDATSRMSKFDDSKYDVIVFDEIFFANVQMMAKIKRYSEQNPAKIILATGDTQQLETIDLVSNQIDYDVYTDHCVNTIFPVGIMLKENKRLKTQADKDILRRFKEDIFNEDIPTAVTIKKYFKFVSEIKTTSNIAFKNSTCESVAKDVRKMLKKVDDYEVGEVLVCRKYLKFSASIKCSCNYEYVIKYVKSGSIVLQELNASSTIELKLDVVRKHFIHSYCRTTHSYQGSSIDGKITVLDWRFFFVSRKWLYTSVTRATELKNVFFYDPKEASASYDDAILDKYLAKKVDNYKKQDFQGGRPIGDNYITTDWLKSCFGKNCTGCGEVFSFEIVNGKVISMLTADRRDNSECHHLNNVSPLCCGCNQRKSSW